MAKLKTLAEKQEIRYRLVYIAFAALVIIPIAAFGLLAFGVNPSSASGIVATVAASFSAIVLGFFATSPRDDIQIKED